MIEQRDFVKYVVLTIVTCGLYSIFFWATYIPDINRSCDGDGDHSTEYLIVFLLNIITCGIYSYVWVYQLGNRIYRNGPRYGLNFSETGTTILLFTFLGNLIGIGGFIGAYFIIKNGNYIFDQYNRHVYGAQ